MNPGECGCCANPSSPSSNLFERQHWIYALFREHLFRDHTDIIVKSLFPPRGPAQGARVLELGCGPGFYSCRLAKLFPRIETIGVDSSQSLLGWARSRATESKLENCSFSHDDACSLHMSGETVDAVVVSRLFLIVQEREAVLGEIHRVLKPGGKCFVAEPTTPLKTRLPLWFMRALSRLSGDERRSHPHQGDARVLSRAEFGSMVHSQPWAQVEETKQRGYQYAICTKAAAAMPDFTRSAA